MDVQGDCLGLLHLNVKTNLTIIAIRNTPIPLGGVSAMFPNFGQNDTKRGRNAKSAAETPRAQLKRIGNFMIATSLHKF